MDLNSQMDYAKTYDSYWAKKDRMGSHSFKDGTALAREILDLCGPGRVLDVGSGMGLLVRSLLREGVDAHGVDVSEVAVQAAGRLTPGRFTKGSILDLPFPNDSFDIVISTDCMEHIAEKDVPRALSELRRVSRRFIYLRLATTHDRDRHWHLTVQPRDWWEAACMQVGMRKHPAYLRANAYEAIERDGWQISIPMEKIADDVLTAYPLEKLRDERDLHMDMLREPGRRSDAHLVRYHLACSLVRPGDAILDATCGLGYGSHMLACASSAGKIIGVDGSAYAVDYARRMYGGLAGGPEFHQGLLPQWLETLEDESVDLVLCFETLEHVPDPVALLAQFRRVLSPGGRLVVSVPLDWTEADGRDPNPHHLHVYDWPRVHAEVARFFLVERAFAQSASRRKAGPARERRWVEAGRELAEFSTETLLAGTGPDCEWCLLVGMRNPLEGASMPYRNLEHARDSLPPNWNTTAFARDYRNPWIVRSLVVIGQRISSPALRRQLARTIIDGQSPDDVGEAADRGAALCLLGYGLLEEKDGAGSEESAAFLAASDAYCTRAPSSPSMLRWQVSLLCLKGRLLEASGHHTAALEAYMHCADLDAIAFNPVLATRTVESCLRAGILHLNEGREELAAASWRKGLDLAGRALAMPPAQVVGDLDRPMEFALPELAAVAEYASACAYCLNHYKTARSKPCQWWWQARRNRLDQLSETRRLLQNSLRNGAEIDRLNKVIRAKDDALAVQVAEIRRLERHVGEKHEALRLLAEEIERLKRCRTRGTIRGLSDRLASFLPGRFGAAPFQGNVDLPVDFSKMPPEGKLCGWVFSTVSDAPVSKVRAVFGGKIFPGRLGVYRPDVGEVHPEGGSASGFEIDYDLPGIERTGLRVEVSVGTGAWRVLLERGVIFTPEPNPAAAAPYSIRQPASVQPRRPRVLHVLANFMVGGSSRLVVDLVENLGDAYEQSVLTSFAPVPPAYVGLDIVEIKKSAGAGAILSHLKRVAPAFVHVHYWGDVDECWYSLVFKAAENLCIPVIQNVNTPVAPFASKAVWRNVFVSDTIRKEFGRDGSSDTVIYPGSDFSLFQRSPDDQPPDDWVGMVYRLEIDKLNAAAIEPFIHCVRRRPSTKVLIVGGGSLLPTFKSAVATAGLSAAFEFTGYVPYQDLPALYKRMSLFVAPVWKESFGQVSPFAMNMRIPVVGYNVGAIPEIIDDPTLLAPAGDSAALGKLMASLLDDHARRVTIGTRNAARAADLFTVEGMISRYRDLYAQVPRIAP